MSHRRATPSLPNSPFRGVQHNVARGGAACFSLYSVLFSSLPFPWLFSFICLAWKRFLIELDSRSCSTKKGKSINTVSQQAWLVIYPAHFLGYLLGLTELSFVLSNDCTLNWLECDSLVRPLYLWVMAAPPRPIPSWTRPQFFNTVSNCNCNCNHIYNTDWHLTPWLGRVEK